jgi:hypothetical protein
LIYRSTVAKHYQQESALKNNAVCTNNDFKDPIQSISLNGAFLKLVAFGLVFSINDVSFSQSASGEGNSIP